MESYVWKRRFQALLGNVIFTAVFPISFLLIFGISFPISKDELFIFLVFSSPFIITAIIVLFVIKHEGSIVIFDHDNVKCTFIKKVRRKLNYPDIQECGLFKTGTMYDGSETFIYISRYKLDKKKIKTVKAYPYLLYTKTKDVIVVQYKDDIMEFLKSKCPDIPFYEEF